MHDRTECMPPQPRDWGSNLVPHPQPDGIHLAAAEALCNQHFHWRLQGSLILMRRKALALGECMPHRSRDATIAINNRSLVASVYKYRQDRVLFPSRATTSPSFQIYTTPLHGNTMTNPQKDEIHMSASHWASNSSQTHLIEGDSSRLDPAVNLSRRSNVGSVGVPPPEGLPTPRNLVPVSSLTDDGRTLGIPATRRLLTWKERAIATICLLSFGAAVVSVAVGMIAVRMGQKYQLVLLGFSLSVMAYCARKELLYLLVCIETNSRGKSGKATTLQHLAALLCYDPWSDSTSFRYRLALLATIALPLGLSAAYRLFQGGQSSSEITSDVLNFGLTGAPGEARHSAHSFWYVSVCQRHTALVLGSGIGQALWTQHIRG